MEGISCGIIMVQNVYVVIQCQTFSSLLLINESVSSSEGIEASSSSDRLPTTSSLAHAMVQKRLEQMIRERFVKSRNEGGSREIKTYGDSNSDGTKCIVMVAMDKYSYDPRKNFIDSMVKMITANQIEDPKYLRIDIEKATGMIDHFMASLVLFLGALMSEHNGYENLVMSHDQMHKKSQHFENANGRRFGNFSTFEDHREVKRFESIFDAQEGLMWKNIADSFI
ncbi:hypothetical protein Sjap_007234 [Stephania japonica]|uniref:Transcription repressor n=1 Tax=Stephania japonica TaxID=461633 RepID=A0AAP0JN21_9MAGN